MKIVCFHLNQIGDLAFSLPALKCIRDTYPDAHITCVVRPGAKEVMESVGFADDVLCRSGGFNNEKINLIKSLSIRKYDLAIVFSQSAECAMLAFFSRAPKRVGFINTSLGMFLTHHIDFNHPPSTENNLRLVSSVGCKVTAKDYVDLLKPTQEQLNRANKLLAEHGIKPDDVLVAFSPGTSGRRSVKEWTNEGYAAVGRHLIDRGIKVVVLGTEPASNIVKDCGEIIDLSGKTNLGEVVAILSKCKTLVAVDSGVLHLCAATGTKVVGLYGSTNPKITGPQGDGHIILTSNADCSPCIRTECSYERKCMTNLTPIEVIAAVDSLLRFGVTEP